MQKRSAAAVILFVVVVAAMSIVGTMNRAAMPSIELPAGIQNVRTSDRLLWTGRSVRFDLDGGPTESSVIDFYNVWARNAGWQLVSLKQDQWSGDMEKVEAELPAGNQVEYRVVDWLHARWINQDRTWSLRIRLAQCKQAPACVDDIQRVELVLERADPAELALPG